MTTKQDLTWRQKIRAAGRVWVEAMRQLGPFLGTVSLLLAVVFIFAGAEKIETAAAEALADNAGER